MKRAIVALALVSSFVLSSCSSAGAGGGTEPVRLTPEEAATLFETLPRSTEAGFEPPKVVRRVEPRTGSAYLSRYAQVEATVEAIVDEEGRVLATRYVSGNREWATDMRAAIEKWTFAPARRDGVPLMVVYRETATVSVKRRIVG